jgi:hypothetical protein
VAAWAFPERAGARRIPKGTVVCVAGNQRCMLLVAALTLGVSARRQVARYVRDLRKRVRALGMDQAPLDRILGRDPGGAPPADGADPEIDGPVVPAHTPVLVRVLERWADADGKPGRRSPTTGRRGPRRSGGSTARPTAASRRRATSRPSPIRWLPTSAT